MEQDLCEKIDAVSELAIEAKKKEKLKKNQQQYQFLERCKLHGGPLTAIDLDRLNSLSDDQVMAEAGYLKKSIAPNLRYKRLVGKHYVHFTIDEIKSQIRDTILPHSNIATELGQLLKSVFADRTKTVPGPDEGNDVPIGILGKWVNGEKEKVGIVIDKSIIQFYKKVRHGLVPVGLPQPLEEWTLQNKIQEYSYIEKYFIVYLVF